jgi:hypothetical protein
VVGRIVLGTGAAAGSGDYSWSLPVTAATTITNPAMGLMRSYDSSANNLSMFSVFIDTATTMGAIYPATWPAGTNTRVGNATPWTWADSDQMNWLVTYEVA